LLVFRITTAKWAGKLSGSGHPARWNSKGIFVIYSASSRALACLENLVHRSGEGNHQNFRITEIDVPDDCTLKTVHIRELPETWHKAESYTLCQRIGDRWIEENNSLLLQVPSSIIREETNVLINPNHPEFPKIRVRSITPFQFDERL
jgi:RES domain-containing protein